MSEVTPDSTGPGKDELKRAFKAFKKRLKVMRLDDESRISGGHLSSGRRSEIVAITPPNDFPPEVWEELARRGRIKPARDGMYELIDEG